MLLLIISLLIFGVPMVMLNINRQMKGEQEIINSPSLFWLPNIILYQYELALGEFQLDGVFEDGSYTGLCYLFFVLATFISQVTMLNMLIAIMGDTFEHIIENQELNMIKTKIEVMSELAFNIHTQEDPNEYRFLFIVTPDEDEQDSLETWEGSIKQMTKLNQK